jgi:hypothetical protein
MVAIPEFYEKLRTHARRFEVEDLASDGATLSVPVIGPLEGTTLQGDGWSATLNSGWAVRPAVRAGSFIVVREN